MTAVLVVPCALCGTRFERVRATGRFCSPCRRTRKREAWQRRDEARRQLKQDSRDLVNAYVIGGIEPDYAEHSIWPKLDDYLDSLGDFAGASWGLVPDRMPPGSNSAYGSEDGRSTDYADLAGELDEEGALSESHRWFLDNPHWAFEI